MVGIVGLWVWVIWVWAWGGGGVWGWCCGVFCGFVLDLTWVGGFGCV